MMDLFNVLQNVMTALSKCWLVTSSNLYTFLVKPLLVGWHEMITRSSEYLAVLGLAFSVISTVVIFHVSLYQVVLFVMLIWSETGTVEGPLLQHFLLKGGATMMLGSTFPVLFGWLQQVHDVEIVDPIQDLDQQTLELPNPDQKDLEEEASELTKRTWKKIGWQISLIVVSTAAMFALVTWFSHAGEQVMITDWLKDPANLEALIAYAQTKPLLLLRIAFGGKSVSILSLLERMQAGHSSDSGNLAENHDQSGEIKSFDLGLGALSDLEYCLDDSESLDDGKCVGDLVCYAFWMVICIPSIYVFK